MLQRVEILFLLFLLFYTTYCYIDKSGKEDFSKCKIHYSRSESSYTKFYAITDEHRANSSLIFDFHFSVLAPRDAHILLTPSPLVQKSDPVYEIVLGAGGNTFSDIRRLQKQRTKSSKRTYDLLSFVDVRSFWIHISHDGLIEVGIEGADIAFLSWRDPDPLPVYYFSFCTWGGVEAKWFYDCAREDGSTSNSQEIQKSLTPTEKLKKYLFDNYDPYIRPTLSEDELTIVHLGFKPHRVYLDEMSSKFTIQGIIQMQWLDEKINWSPEEYNNIQELNLKFREIWLPNIIIYNSAASPGTDYSKTLNLVISSEGWVTWLTQVTMETWCDASGLEHWPQDDHSCEVQLGFWTLDNYAMLQTALNSSEMSQKYPSEWEISSLESGYYLISTPWNSAKDTYSSTFVMRFKLHRSSSFYTTIYFAPIVAVSIFLLSSFWVTPYAPYRISLYCFQLVLLSFVLTKLDSNIPGHPTEVPYLVLLYAYGLIATLVALLFSILLINLVHRSYSKPLPYFIYRFLSLNFVKTILYMQTAKFSESYNKLIDDNTKEMDIQGQWRLLGLALDRFLFFVYFILIIIFLSKQY